MSVVTAVALACTSPGPRPLPQSPVARPTTPASINAADAYRRAGFLTAAGDIPFVGSVHVMAGPDADNTLVIVALSFPNRSLTFMRDGADYRAAYDVTYDVRDGAATVLHRRTHAEVRVASFRETGRAEESVIVQQTLMLPPGSFTLQVRARDASTLRDGSATMHLTVPRVTSAFVAVAPVYQVVPRTERSAPLRAVVNPRATAVFGRDTTLRLYLESYGSHAPRHARVLVGAQGSILAEADASFTGDGDVHSAEVRLPVSQIGIGLLTATVVPEGEGAPIVVVPVAVRAGEELALAPFDEMLEYLRYFVPPDRLLALRTATGDERARIWHALLADGDSVASGDAHGTLAALRDYLRRVQVANAEFRDDDIAGWLTDRGKVFSVFGPPDDIDDASVADGGHGVASLIWHYRRPGVHLVFTDRSSRGRWRLTAGSEAAFDSALTDVTRCRACR